MLRAGLMLLAGGEVSIPRFAHWDVREYAEYYPGGTAPSLRKRRPFLQLGELPLQVRDAPADPLPAGLHFPCAELVSAIAEWRSLPQPAVQAALDKLCITTLDALRQNDATVEWPGFGCFTANSLPNRRRRLSFASEPSLLAVMNST
jgi:hypothetical protein